MISWDFIEKMLNNFNRPVELRILILSCLKNVQYTPIINGKKTQTFKPSKEIRQGDTISPYIFILEIEYLNHLIQEKISSNQLHPFKFKNKEPKISHLLFIDDILLFSKANTHSIEAMNEVLMNFCTISGRKINSNKSKAWFSQTVYHSKISLFQNTLIIRQSTDLGSYLGYPLKPTYRKVDFNFIVDKLNLKLQGWKAILLSKIGRTQLISTISNLSSHTMKAFLLPKSILTKIDSKTRDLFWSHTTNMRKMHTINQGKIAKPKSLCLLGIRKAEHQNKVNLLNLIWRFNHSLDKIWTQILTNKFGRNLPKRRTFQSYTYRSIQQILLYIFITLA